MSFLDKNSGAVFALLLVIMMLGTAGYLHYDKNRMPLDADCRVVMVLNKTSGYEPVMNDKFIGLMYGNFVTLKLDQYEWREEVDYETFNNIELNTWVKSCHRGSNLWIEKIVKI